ncbi:MAG: sensor domain-containing diguanylate cyclase [Actinobacteria bacterium]|nr:sensor domain-containing diguanylate cyclase [Actinomycetota bacterium]
MTDKNKKMQLCLTVAEIALLATFFIFVGLSGPEELSSRPSSHYIYLTIIAVLLGIAVTRTAISGKLGREHENDRKDLWELQELNTLLNREKTEVEKELRTYKINHEKISKNVAELFTLQMVSDTINSTLELDRLLNTVNDIIVGIMGVNTCTICIFEENQSGVRYLVSNEKRYDLLDNIRNRALYYLDKIDKLSDKIFMEEVKDFEPVTRITFTPVIKNKFLLGVIITGHTEDNLFDAEDARFMEIICNQISMAIENAKLYEKVNTMANTDFLTGLYNRTYFFSCFDKILANIPEERTLAVAMFDIDDFKIVNDTHGHDAGDAVLKGMTGIIKNMIRKDDVFARYGGEEFILIMQNISGEKGLERLNQIREIIQDTIFDHNGISLSITVSIGAAFYEKEDTQDTLIKKADLALYKAKNTGKNRIVLYDREIKA